MSTMARSPVPKHLQTVSAHLDCNRQQDPRSARGLPLRAPRSQFGNGLIEADNEFGYEDGCLRAVWSQFRADGNFREDRQRSSSSFLPIRLHKGGRSSTSNLNEAKPKFGYPISSRSYPATDFVNQFGAGRSRIASYSFDRHPYQLSHPSHSSLPQNLRTQQWRSSQITYQDNCESTPRLLSSSPPNYDAERLAQDRSDWSPASASIHPVDAPIYHLYASSPPDASTHKLRGLTRRPRVQKPHRRASRLPADATDRPVVDPETPRATDMDCSVMSVRRSNPDGSGSSLGSRFVLPPTTAHPITIGGSSSGAHIPSEFPSSHVDAETERPRSEIKAPEEAGSAFMPMHSIPNEGPYTLSTPSLMNSMEEESSSLLSVSTPKAPPPHQHSLIREDLQQREGERPIARCRMDPRTSICEQATAESRKSSHTPHSASPRSVSRLPGHEPSANNALPDQRQPEQQTLFQELYQILGTPAHPRLGASRSGTEAGMETLRDGKPGEGFTPRRPQGAGAEQVPPLHVDVLLAQRVARDAMREQGEDLELSDRPWTLSASDCGEEALDSNSDRPECELDRKHSTRSVFDWRYA